MIRSGLTDWNQVAGIWNPPTVRSVKSRAKRLSAVGACSNADQKIAAKTNSTTITATRFFSAVESFPNDEDEGKE